MEGLNQATGLTGLQFLLVPEPPLPAAGGQNEDNTPRILFNHRNMMFTQFLPQNFHEDICFICHGEVREGDFIFVFTPCQHFGHHRKSNDALLKPSFIPKDAPADLRTCMESFLYQSFPDFHPGGTFQCPTCRAVVEVQRSVVEEVSHTRKVRLYPPIAPNIPFFPRPDDVRHNLFSVPKEAPDYEILCGVCLNPIEHGQYRVNTIPCNHMVHPGCLSGSDHECRECGTRLDVPYFTPQHLEHELVTTDPFNISMAIRDKSIQDWQLYDAKKEAYDASMETYLRNLREGGARAL